MCAGELGRHWRPRGAVTYQDDVLVVVHLDDASRRGDHPVAAGRQWLPALVGRFVRSRERPADGGGEVGDVVGGLAALFGELVDDADTAVGEQLGGLGRLRLGRSEEHTSELQSLMRISYAVFCLKKKKKTY